MRGVRVILVLCSLLAGATLAASAVPPLLNYQGVLRNAAGETVPDGNYSVTFRVWDSETGGDALWQEGRLVTVQKGLFTVLLGSIVPIPDTLFARPDRWLGLQVGLDPEMTPRQQLVTVPFAWHSLSADKSDTASVAREVDTSGFSAYADLLSEGKIGTGADQVAPGNHVHPPVLGATTMMRFEDTAVVQVATSTPGFYLLKTITIPPNELGHFVKIVCSFSSQQNGGTGGNHNYVLKINGEWAANTETFGGGDYSDLFIELVRLAGTHWTGHFRVRGSTASYTSELSWLDPSVGVTVELLVQKADTQPFVYEGDELIVIYDKD